MVEENSVDKRVKLYKAVSGLIPGGSFLVEYLVDRIPDQRMERLFRFIEGMNKRLEKLESLDFVKTHEYAMLAETSIIESTKPITEKRLEWLTSITVPTNYPSDLEIEFRRKAVDLLSTLSDNDVEYLLKHVDWTQKLQYEQSMPRKHFISRSDRDNLSGHELFIKNLQNHRLDVYRSSLLEKGVIEKRSDNRNEDFEITELGKLIVYVITDEYPRNLAT